MKAPVFLTLAALAAAPPLAAQSAPDFLCGETDENFHDLGIVQLVDAADALRDPLPGLLPAVPAAPDASLCNVDSLLFCDLNPLAPAERFHPPATAPPAEVSDLESRGAPAGAQPVPVDPGPVVACSDSATGSVMSTWQPVVADVPPAEPVPEPSAILLVVGAAAWILLRRKH